MLNCTPIFVLPESLGEFLEAWLEIHGAGAHHRPTGGQSNGEAEETGGGGNLSLPIFRPEETARQLAYFFLPAGCCLAAAACFFFWSALLTLTCFWEDFFWVAFGDLSPMMFCFLLRVDSPAECLFLRRSSPPCALERRM